MVTPTEQKNKHQNAAPSALCYGGGRFVYLSPVGELRHIAADDIKSLALSSDVIVCHKPFMLQKTGLARMNALDILELYAFVHPACYCTPSPAGLAKALGLDIPESPDDYPVTLCSALAQLMTDLAAKTAREKILDLAQVMGLNGKGWGWTPTIYGALGETYDPQKPITSARNLLNVWNKLDEWAEEAPLPPPDQFPVTGEEIREKLTQVLLTKRSSEFRAEQANYATRLGETFEPLHTPDDQPHILLAEAGTGVGKTLGYLAPATLWSDKNEASVWISTYTKNLQRQLARELEYIYPDPELRSHKVTIRKGRENYLCLLNFEDLAAGAHLAKSGTVALAAGLIARWIMETEDGDLTGIGFHGWLPGLLGNNMIASLADRRGECVFSACDHYKHCFSEKTIRKSRRTPIVIANHAVVMTQAALAAHTSEDVMPSRYIFDEGHHLFDAADSSFSCAMTALEGYNLRRWLKGPEDTGRKTRARGLKKRIEDIISEDVAALRLVDDIIHHTSFLPREDWLARQKTDSTQGSAEHFIYHIAHQIWARAEGRDGPYSLEIPPFPLSPQTKDATAKLLGDLKALRVPLVKLSSLFKQKLSDDINELSTDMRGRLESVALSLDRRIEHVITPWIDMTQSLLDDQTNPDVVDWMEIERIDGKIFDIGLHRHFIDPVKAMAQALKPYARGIAVTSATLGNGHESDWQMAEAMTGARHLTDNPVKLSIPSPYRYKEQTKVIIVTDLNKADTKQLAAAYRALFQASGGGGLGLFTSIQRLKAVHRQIAAPLNAVGLNLYAQHVDMIDVGTLVDMFRDDKDSCLLGTDAVRDGVDIPGESLRLIIFDRVPWPRATLLHKARKAEFGGSLYDDHLTRLKLKQAYGRLIRHSTDRGVFILLDNACPSRLLSAFPEGVDIERIGIQEALEKTRGFFLGNETSAPRKYTGTGT
ncbi:MAG: ATP-dependent DNA helicase [Pseudobdellovibrionaceae bacterium]